jgi:hypothetical protein
MILEATAEWWSTIYQQRNIQDLNLGSATGMPSSDDELEYTTRQARFLFLAR